LLGHKLSSIACVRLVNFNAEKRKKKEQKIRKSRCFEHIAAYREGFHTRIHRLAKKTTRCITG
jgi:hypothetical protein